MCLGNRTQISKQYENSISAASSDIMKEVLRSLCWVPYLTRKIYEMLVVVKGNIVPRGYRAILGVHVPVRGELKAIPVTGCGGL
jgi:hypothetical protein